MMELPQPIKQAFSVDVDLAAASVAAVAPMLRSRAVDTLTATCGVSKRGAAHLARNRLLFDL